MKLTEPLRYKVNEIFYSLQGEGFHTGMPAVFVRLSGCNLSCDFCDTQHNDGKDMTAHEIVEEVCGYPPCGRVIITGGEPTVHDLSSICDALHDKGYAIHIETNGTLPVKGDVDWVTCSPKEAASPHPYYVHPSLYERADEVKIVFTGDNGFEREAEKFITKNRFLQPCSGMNTEETVNYILSHPTWRLSLQTHRFLGIK